MRGVGLPLVEMSSEPHARAAKSALGSDIGDLDAAAEARRRAVWRLSMSERLARVHELCRQIDAVKGAARVR